MAHSDPDSALAATETDSNSALRSLDDLSSDEEPWPAQSDAAELAKVLDGLHSYTGWRVWPEALGKLINIVVKQLRRGAQ